MHKTFKKALAIARTLPGFFRSSEPYIDFKIKEIKNDIDESTSVAKVTLVVPIRGAMYAYYVLHVSTSTGDLKKLPNADHCKELKKAVDDFKKIMSDAGITVSRLDNESPTSE